MTLGAALAPDRAPAVRSTHPLTIAYPGLAGEAADSYVPMLEALGGAVELHNDLIARVVPAMVTRAKCLVVIDKPTFEEAAELAKAIAGARKSVQSFHREPKRWVDRFKAALLEREKADLKLIDEADRLVRSSIDEWRQAEKRRAEIAAKAAREAAAAAARAALEAEAAKTAQAVPDETVQAIIDRATETAVKAVASPETDARGVSFPEHQTATVTDLRALLEALADPEVSDAERAAAVTISRGWLAKCAKDGVAWPGVTLDRAERLTIRT